MYRKCPKCGHDNGPGAAAESCPACGLVYEKWLRQRFASSRPAARADAGDRSDWWGRLAATLFYVKPRTNSIEVYARMALYLGLFIWGWYFILLDLESNAIGRSFMHNVNLVFHEAGHIIFMPFGWFMSVLGGSLAQLLMPAVVIVAFVFWRRDNFAASVGLWWFGQSMMDLAPYINDARALALPLLGGGTGMDRPGMHDWHNILGDLGLLRQDHAIAAIADGLGALIMLTALAWGGFMLYREYRSIDRRFDG